MGLFKVTAVFVLSLGLAACGSHGFASTPQAASPSEQSHELKPQDSIGGIGTSFNAGGVLAINLLDAPPKIAGQTLTHLNVAIVRIDVIKHNKAVMIASYNPARVVDVLQHQDGHGETIAEAVADKVTYGGVSIVVDPTLSNAQTANATYGLSFVRSGTQSTSGAGWTTATVQESPRAVAITTMQKFSLDAHTSVDVDFNAYETLGALTGTTIVARPTMFLAAKDTEGEIEGSILNNVHAGVCGATVVAIAARGEVANTVWTGRDGSFKLHTLAAGTYHLLVYNTYENAAGVAQTSNNASPSATQTDAPVDGGTVTVTAGKTTHIKAIAD